MAKKIKKHANPELFAGTPPLEALKLLLSTAAASGEEDICLMHNDVSRAYFHAKAMPDVYVNIIDEDWKPGDEGRCGKLDVGK